MVRPVFLTMFFLLFAAMVFFAWNAWEQAAAYQDTTLALVQKLDAQSNLDLAKAKWLEALSLGSYSGYSEHIEAINQLKEAQGAYRTSTDIMTALFFGVLPFALGAAYWVRRDWGDCAYAMLAVSVVALAVGLAAPILSVSASKTLPVLGDTVFQFESKGVLSTILSLKDSGNLWLAVLLGVFSVVLPLVKTVLTGFSFFARNHHLTLRGLKLVKHIGKWSMADVFVVAILVAFFANNGKGLTDAEVQSGLYFFAAYVVLSILATQIISHYAEGAARAGQP